MGRVLFHAVHHPHPQHVDDLLGAMRRISEAAPEVDGLEEIGAFHDAEGGRVIALSVWTSADALRAGMERLFASIGDVPFDEWERRPRELLTLPEAV